MTHADNSLPELHPADGPWSIYLHVPYLCVAVRVLRLQHLRAVSDGR